jgi:hypothetical protein
MPKTIETLKAGDTDSFGRKVLLVRAQEGQRYIIYETTSFDLIVDGPESEKCNQPEVHKAANEIADLTIQHPKLKQKYNSRIAYAFKIALDGDTASAANSLAAVAADMDGFLRRQATLSYQLGALIGLAIPSAILGLTYLLTSPSDPAIRLVSACVFGAIGGFFSVILGSRQLVVSGKDSFLSNIVYGASRIFIGAISALVMVFLIKADLLLGALNRAENFDSFVIACIVAGFSERLVPNVLRSLEAGSRVKR